MEVSTNVDNFIEVESVEEANKVDLSVYRWSEKFSAERRRYCFVVRMKK